MPEAAKKRRGPGRPRLSREQRILRKVARLRKEIEALRGELDRLGRKEFVGKGGCQVGRPKATIMDEYFAALEGYVLALDQAVKEAGGGDVVDALTKAAFEGQKDPASDDTRPGRPPKTRIEWLEKEIRRHQSRIQRIQDGRERSGDPSSRLVGRKGKTKKQKIHDIELRIASLRQQVLDEERRLTAYERKDLELRRMRRTASAIRAELRESGVYDQYVWARNNREAVLGRTTDVADEVFRLIALEKQVGEKHEELKRMREEVA